MRGVMVAIVSGLLAGGCSVVGIRTTPEPAYTVERMVGDVQIRRYGPRVAAETIVSGDEVRARSVGFERLAGYIFGGNGARRTIAMTAPVAQSAAGGARSSPAGRSLGMTAPVDQAPVAGGAWRIRFFMPSGETLATLPRPNDAEVALVTVPAETVAALRYGGTPTRKAVGEAGARLLRQLAASGIAVEGAPFDWFYDPPWTLPPLRRNEAVVRVHSG